MILPRRTLNIKIIICGHLQQQQQQQQGKIANKTTIRFLEIQ